MRIIFKLVVLTILLLVVGSCSSDNTMRSPYKQLEETLDNNDNVSNNLIVTYDLGRLDNSNCVYAIDLGLITNSEKYQQDYIARFNQTSKSAYTIKSEAIKKIIRINEILLSLHLRYKILSGSQYHYVKKLSRVDITKIDVRRELSRLDGIIKHVPMMLPECGSRVTSHYGKRKHPVTKKYKFHAGIDLCGKVAAPIFASATGHVTFAGKRNGYGNIVEISHGSGVKTKYAHLKNISVKRGQKVSRGQVIGRQGRTGKVTNEHLHFEIWVNGKHVNPYDFIACECKCKKK